MKIKYCAILAIVCIAAIAFSACGDDVIGYWVVDELSVGDVVMTGDDAQAIGYTAPGSIKLQKSGNCEIALLDDEYTGTWEQSKDGTITLKYGEELTATAVIDKNGVMTFTDGSGLTAKLSK